MGLGLTLRKTVGKANEKVRKSKKLMFFKARNANVLFYNIHARGSQR